MVIEKKNISDIKLAEYNPRKELKKGDKEYERIRKSIEEFGLVEPLVWNKRTGNLVGGHQRLKVLKDLGVDTVPVAIVDLDKHEEKKLNIALNKITGEWDFERLADIIRQFDTDGINYDVIGWEDSEIKAIINAFTQTVEKDYNNDTEIPRMVEYGDIWQLGRHILICCDCADANDVIKQQFGMVNVIITSSPYATKRSDQYFSPSEYEFPLWFTKLSKNFYDVLSPDGSMFWNIKEHVSGGQKSLYVIKTILAMVEMGWKYIDEYIWVKKGLPGNFKMRLRNDYEPVHWFAKEDPDIVARIYQEGVMGDVYVDEYGKIVHVTKTLKVKFYPKAVGNISTKVKGLKTNKSNTGNIGMKGVKGGAGVVLPGNVIYAKKNTGSWEHPAMYSVELPAFFICLTTDENDVVYDPFGGAGTTLIAAHNLNRRCVIVEMKDEYCDIIIERYKTVTGQKDIKKIGNVYEKARKTGKTE